MSVTKKDKNLLKIEIFISTWFFNKKKLSIDNIIVKKIIKTLLLTVSKLSPILANAKAG